jgi:molecular chaperone DnaK
MGRVIGIDLGTTNSVAAFKLADVEVVTADGNTPPDRKLTRSVVAFHQGGQHVGESAYNQLRAEPENVIISVKRLIGRGYGEPTLQEHLPRFSYKVTRPTNGTDNGISVWLGGKEYAPEDMSAEILKQVARNAEAYFQAAGQGDAPVTEAVITIPAYFNDKQRHATRSAALKAGLIPNELLPEPTAAAISYGFSPEGEGDAKTILVYDFGGGTFDASLITAAGNQFIEQGKAGDLWLGGDDIDELIIQHVKVQVAREEGLGNVDELVAKMPHYQRVRFVGDLKAAAERAKIELSSRSAARIIPATPLLDELGMAVSVDVELTREQFEAMIMPMVDRTTRICRQALEDLEYTPEMVDVVLLVGGSSQIPLVQQRARELFGDKVVVHPRPMYAVAEGAAIVAAGLTEKVGTVSRDYFIKLESNPRYKVVARNEVLPVVKTDTFKTAADGQRLICLEFFNEDWVSQADEPIGKMWLGLDQYYPRGTEILVTFELDETSNHLAITAALKNDPRIKVSRTFSRGKADEVIYDRLEDLIANLNSGDYTLSGIEEGLRLAVPVVHAANMIIDERSQEERSDYRERAEENLRKLEAFTSEDVSKAQFLAGHCDMVIELAGPLLPTAQRERLASLSLRLNRAIEASDLSGMQAIAEEAERELENVPQEVSLLRFTAMATFRANQLDPARGSVMASRLDRLIGAFQRGDHSEAGRLFRELSPDVEHFLGQDMPTGFVQTVVTK